MPSRGMHTRQHACMHTGVIGGCLAWKPPEGWWSIMRELGSERRCPACPAASSSEAIEAAWPTHSVLMGLRMYCDHTGQGIINSMLVGKALKAILKAQHVPLPQVSTCMPAWCHRWPARR